MISYQKLIWDKLPHTFTRAIIFKLGQENDVNLNSVNSYIHSWTKRGLIKKIATGTYEKLFIEFVPSKYSKTLMPVIKEAPLTVELKASQSSVPTTTPIFDPDDSVLDMFSLKTATDEEILKELVARGYKWTGMQRIITVDVPFAEYVTETA